MGLVPHPLMGSELARDLELPESIVRAISSHHLPLKPEEPLSVVCWLGESCASVFEVGGQAQNFAFAESKAQSVGLSPEDVASILQSVPEEVAALSDALDCAHGPSSQQAGPPTVERELSEMRVQYDQLVRALDRVLDERDFLAERLNQASLDG